MRDETCAVQKGRLTALMFLFLVIERAAWFAELFCLPAA